MIDLLAKGTDRGYSMIGVGLSAGLSGSRRARTVQDPLPALDLDWATNRSLPASYGPTPTFTRASTGTYFDGQGILKTAAVNGPRFNHTYNGTSWVSRGLLVEEQRTNGLLRSNEFSNAAWDKLNVAVSTDSTISPEGTTAAKVTPSTSSSVQKAIYQTLTIANSANAHSIYIKAGTQNFIQLMFNGADFNYANFDISTGVTGNKTAGVSSSSISDVGNGWYRISMTLTNSGATGWTLFWINSLTDGRAPSVTSTGSIYLFGAQYEAGAFPTSYIPTTTASTTRSADVCQITGSDFSGFWNGTEGSFAVEYDRLAAVDLNFSSGYPRIVTAVKTSDTSRAVTLFASQSPSGEAFFVQDGTVQAWFSAGSLASANVSTKLSTGYKANDFAASLNGAAVATDTSGTIPSGIDRMDIGNEYGVTRFHNGHIARLRYYPTRLTNAKLQELST